MREVDIINLLKDYAAKYGKTPTAAAFCKEYNLFASAIIRRYNCTWNSLIEKAGLKPNKATKRSKEQLLLWLKTHPNCKYNQIDFGIRGALEELFGSISNAREAAGLAIIDWRGLSKTKKAYSAFFSRLFARAFAAAAPTPAPANPAAAYFVPVAIFGCFLANLVTVVPTFFAASFN